VRGCGRESSEMPVPSLGVNCAQSLFQMSRMPVKYITLLWQCLYVLRYVVVGAGYRTFSTFWTSSPCAPTYGSEIGLDCSAGMMDLGMGFPDIPRASSLSFH
jgi:hypothetical protein